MKAKPVLCGHPAEPNYGHQMCYRCWWRHRYPEAQPRRQVTGLRFRDDAHPEYVIPPLAECEACPRCHGFVQMRPGVFEMPDEWRCVNCGWARMAGALPT